MSRGHHYGDLSFMKIWNNDNIKMARRELSCDDVGSLHGPVSVRSIHDNESSV
jgi:hypothetical protein